MASPLRSEIHVNRPLGNIAVCTIQDETDFVCDKVFPVVPVQKQSDRYFVYNRDYWFRTGAQKRAPGTESAGGGFDIDNSPSYYCDKWAFHMDVADELAVNCDDPLDIQRDAVRYVTRNILLRREKLFASRYMAPGVWGGFGATNSNGVYTISDFAPATKWSDDRSNPVADVAMLKTGIKRTTSLEPNVMVVSHDVNERLKQHPLVLSRLKITELRVVTEDLLASLFGVKKYLVSSAIENVAQEGQVGSYNFITGNKLLLVYAAEAPSILSPTAGYCFSWSGMFGASALGSRIKTFRMEHLESERIEAELAFDFHVVAPECGVLGTNLI